VNGVINMSFRAKDYANALTLLPDGQILIAGTSSDVWNEGYDFDFIVAKFKADGILDASFGNNGKTIVGLTNEGEVALFVKVLSDGKIMVAGEHNSYPYGFEQVRLLSTGIPDVDFGENGIVLTELPTSYIQAITTQVDGKIVATGYYNPGACCSAIRLIRFQTNGSLDPTFGDGGIVSQISDTGQSYSLAMQADGKILISGGGGIGAGPNHTDFTMYRYVSGLNLFNTDFEMIYNSFVIHPNPVKEILNLDFYLDQPAVLSVNLYNVAGKKVANLLENKMFNSGFGTQQFQVSEHLSQGVYFLKITNGNQVKNVRMFKR